MNSLPKTARLPPRRRRLPRAMRRKVLILASLGLAALGFASLDRSAPILVWNSSASAPVGLYLVLPETRLRTGDMVLVRPPDAIADLATRRGYLPRGVPLIKGVAAVGGDEVCAHGDELSINGDVVAQRLKTDSSGRPLPWCGLALEKWRANFSLSGGGLEQNRAFVAQGRVPPRWIIEPVDECANGTFCLPS